LGLELLEERRLLAVVAARHLFYNESGTASPLRYDGNDGAINANDDLAIAPDKAAYRPGLAFTINRLTNNAKPDSDARVLGSNVVWQGQGGTDGGTDYEIFWYDGSTTTQLTENALADRFPEISSLGVMWERGSGTSQEVILHDFISETPLTSNAVFDGNAALIDNRVVWEQGSGNGIEILQWLAGATTNISQNVVVDRNPQGAGANTVWVKGSTPAQEVMFYDGVNPAVPVGSSTRAMEDARVSGQRVVWEGFAGTTSNDREIYLYDGVTADRLTNNGFPDFDPQIEDQNVVWWAGTFNNFHIYFYDGNSIIQLSSGIRNQFPKIHNQHVVWQGYDGNDNEIFLWDGDQVYQITDNTADDTNPQIHGNHIVWQSQSGLDGTSQEIYEAYFGPSGPATFANVSSYSKGINGIMIDIAGLPGGLSNSDFTFKVGNNNTPSTWVAAPDPASISIRTGAGVLGSDRVTIVWPNGAIQKTWLQVIFKGNDAIGGFNTNSGLVSSDIFYFGNAVGDSGLGNSATQATVSVTDELAARNNPQSVFNNIPLTNTLDFNRDGAVNISDQLIARNNPTSIGNVLRFVNLTHPPAAPETPANGLGESGIAATLVLSAQATGSQSNSPGPARIESTQGELTSQRVPAKAGSGPSAAAGNTRDAALDELSDDDERLNELLELLASD